MQNNEEIKKKLKKIFDSSNNGYLEDKFVIDDDSFLKYVYMENDNAIGYLAVYKNKDFIFREHYPFKIDFTSNDTYLWHLCVDKKHNNKGIGTSLILHAIKTTKGNVYSTVNIKNQASLHLHKKLGFKEELQFSKIHIGKNETFILFKYSPPNIIKV